MAVSSWCVEPLSGDSLSTKATDHFIRLEGNIQDLNGSDYLSFLNLVTVWRRGFWAKEIKKNKAGISFTFKKG